MFNLNVGIYLQVYSTYSALKMEIVCFFGTLVSTYESSRRQNPSQQWHSLALSAPRAAGGMRLLENFPVALEQIVTIIIHYTYHIYMYKADTGANNLANQQMSTDYWGIFESNKRQFNTC
jgi:hypothetical protein